MSDLLVKGNSKVKALIFNLPAIITCKPIELECHKYCYARKAERRFPNVVKARQRNFRASLKTDFVNRMVKELKNKGPKVVRIHSSGDYYSRKYINKWYTIAACCPEVVFFSYTKRDDLFRKLIHLKPNNFRVIWSIDGIDKQIKVPFTGFDSIAAVTSNKTNCLNQTKGLKCISQCKRCLDNRTKVIFFKKH
jgi:DNA repair photolyase